jgi:Thioredoxin-like
MEPPVAQSPALESLPLIAWDSPARLKWHDLATSEVKGKYLGLYFGARWCQPCHRFMAKLKLFYAWRKMEVVYVSLDRDTEQFKVRRALGLDVRCVIRVLAFLANFVMTRFSRGAIGATKVQQVLNSRRITSERCPGSRCIRIPGTPAVASSLRSTGS